MKTDKAFGYWEKFTYLSNNEINISKGIVFVSMIKQNIPICPQRIFKSVENFIINKKYVYY